MTGETPESQLRRLCRQYVRDEPPEWSAAADPRPLLALARRQLLTPLLWGLLRDTLPPDDPVRAALRRDAYRAVARSVELERLAAHLLEGLAAAGVPVLALKGAVLAHRYYREPADRPMRDVDLLVRRQDVGTVLRVAGERGLKRFEDEHSLAFDLRFDSAVVLTPTPRDDAKPSIDLHWDLFNRAQFAPRGGQWLETAWREAEPAALAGHPVRALRTEHAVLHLAAHLGVHHAFSGLLWYCDLGLVIRRGDLDWGRLLAGAEELRLRGVLGLVLAALGELFGVAAPAHVERRLAVRSLRHAVARRLVLDRALRFAPMHHLEHVMPLLVMDRGRDCLVSMLRGVAPSPAWVTLRYGGRWPRAYARHGVRALDALTRILRPRVRE